MSSNGDRLRLGIRHGKVAWVSDAYPADVPATETTKQLAGWCQFVGWADDHRFTADGNCVTHNTAGQL